MSLPAPPAIARRYLKTSLVFLLYGISIGLHLSAAQHMGWATYRAGYVAAHTHVILIGFLVMMVAGLGLWLLPEPPGARAWVPGACWWLLVATVLARSTSELLTGYYGWRWVGAAVFATSCAQAASLCVLGVHLLARLRAVGGSRAGG